jgi:hypothetical protein
VPTFGEDFKFDVPANPTNLAGFTSEPRESREPCEGKGLLSIRQDEAAGLLPDEQVPTFDEDFKFDVPA